MSKRPPGVSRSDYRALQAAQAADQATATTIVLIDDLRDLPTATHVARTSAEGVTMIRAMHERGEIIRELWLDYNLGMNDTIMPVVSLLRELAQAQDRLDVVTVRVHTADRKAAATVIAELVRYGYHVVRGFI